MKKHVLNLRLVPLLVVTLAVSHALGGEGEKKSVPKDRVRGDGETSSTDAKRDHPGETTPEALIVKFLMSIAEGKPATTMSCFDQSKATGRQGSAGWSWVANANAAYHEARRVTAGKFGETGAAVIDEEYKLGLIPGELFPAAIQKRIDKDISVEREGDDKAFVGLFSMHRTNGRWYMTPPADDPWDPVTLPLALTGIVLTKSFEQVPKFVEQSESPEQLRPKIKEAVDAVSKRVIQDLKKSLSTPAPRKQGRSKRSGSDATY